MENNTSLMSVNESALTLDGQSDIMVASQVSFLAVVIFVAITANALVCYVIHRTPHLHNVINMWVDLTHFHWFAVVWTLIYHDLRHHMVKMLWTHEAQNFISSSLAIF
jgi:hypothetical protein